MSALLDPGSYRGACHKPLKYSEETHLLSPKTRFCLFLSLKYDSVMKNETIVPVGGLQEREVYSGIKIC